MGIYIMEHHCSLRIVLFFIPLNYPNSVSFPFCMTNISNLPQFLFLGRPSMQKLNQASRVHCVSPYLCLDCSETWNHSPHYRWLSPENQKRSDWPQTHGGSVCRDSSPLRNLFEYHLRWKAPSLKERGDTYAKVRKERTVTERRQRGGWQQRSIRQEPPRWKGKKDIPEPFFPTPNFQISQTHKQFLPLLTLPCWSPHFACHCEKLWGF